MWVSASTRRRRPTIERFAREFGLHPLAIEDLRKQDQRPKLDAYEGQHMIVAYEAVAEPPSAACRRSTSSSARVAAQRALGPDADAGRGAPSVRRRRRPAADTIGRRAAVRACWMRRSTAISPSSTASPTASTRSRTACSTARPTARACARSCASSGGCSSCVASWRRCATSPTPCCAATSTIVDAATLPYYQDLYDHLVRVLDQLDLYRDLLAAVLDARADVASNNLNAIMKRLTAFTVILMVPTLIAGIYGMNFDFMPELGLAARLPVRARPHGGAAVVALASLPAQGLVLSPRHAGCIGRPA